MRLLRVLRFAARMGFKIEARTQEWFDLAVERELPATITPEDAGAELRALAREERPSVVLKAWEDHDLLEAVSPVLAKKRPGYDSITRLANVREDLFTAGLRPRLATPMLLAVIARLKDREQSAVLSKAGYRSAEAQEILNFDKIVTGAAKELAGKKMNAPIDAFKFLEKLPLDQIAYIMAESGNSAAVSKIRAYLNKWRPIRSGLPQVITELTTLGMPAGAKFDAIVQQVFAMQLTGRGKTPEEREKFCASFPASRNSQKRKRKEKNPKARRNRRPHWRLAAPRGKSTPQPRKNRRRPAKRRLRPNPLPEKARQKLLRNTLRRRERLLEKRAPAASEWLLMIEKLLA